MYLYLKVKGIDENYKLRIYIFEVYYLGFIEVFKFEY